MENILLCHVSGFHPPDIEIQLMKDGDELIGCNQTDLAFKPNWRFHLTKSVAFKPSSGQKYSCKVTHGMTIKDYAWGELGLAKMCVQSFLNQRVVRKIKLHAIQSQSKQRKKTPHFLK